ncbi:MAG: DNA-binding protein [Halobacteriota archaeon]|nr:DNA-binding protein [Halobacteriota archaeon]
MNRRVIIDTNALMIPANFNLDIFSELERLGFEEFIVPNAVVRELEGLQSKLKGREKIAARVALTLLNRCEIVEVDGYADDVIMKLSKEKDAAVFTSDIELKRRLISSGVTVVYLRQQKYLSTSKE